MKSQLLSLKKSLIDENITNENIESFSRIHELKDIALSRKTKMFSINILFKLLTDEQEFFCKCGKNIRTYNYNNKSFRNRCRFCAERCTSEKIKETRKKELIYSGNYLNLHDTIVGIKNIDIEKYISKGAQRKFIKEYPELYFSIIKHTKCIDGVKGVNIRARIIHIMSPEDSKCKMCKNLVNSFSNYSNIFYPVCSNCKPTKNSLEYYKLFYPSNYKEKYQNDRLQRKKSANGLHTKEWYIKKYGQVDGLARYDKHISRMLSKQNSSNTSKISRNLFDNILLHGFHEAEYATHPKERMFILNEKYSELLGQKRIFVDFVFNKKIIEFQGSYWHRKSDNIDKIRKEFLKDLGYDVLFIYENEYNEDNIRELNKCLRFLNGNIIQNRYQILSENGYVDFDNIISTGIKNTLKFKLETETIEVSQNHRFYKNKKEYIAKELRVGQTLKTVNGLQRIVSIENGSSETFDVLEAEQHNYYANNILNHNCEFMGSSHTLISSEKLTSMSGKEPVEIRDGKLKIYHEPEAGHKYIMGVDPAKDGTDAFAVQIIDITDFNFKQVATAQLQIDYLLMPEFIIDWAEYYNKPYIIVENNEGAGQSIADQLFQTYDYENLHFDVKIDAGTNNMAKARKKYPGFRTTPKTRKLILQTLKLFIENNKLEINDSATINEFYQFILLNNKFQADDGAHDDMIMSLAIIFAPFMSTKNFEDMKLLTRNLYGEDLDESEKFNFDELLTIGSFEDGTDENEEVAHKSRIVNWNGFEYGEGFI